MSATRSAIIALLGATVLLVFVAFGWIVAGGHRLRAPGHAALFAGKSTRMAEVGDTGGTGLPPVPSMDDTGLETRIASRAGRPILLSVDWMALGDLDASGLPDLAVIDAPSKALVLISDPFSDGDGSLVATGTLGRYALPGEPTCGLLSDLNQDGAPDIVVGSDGDPSGPTLSIVWGPLRPATECLPAPQQIVMQQTPLALVSAPLEKGDSGDVGLLHVIAGDGIHALKVGPGRSPELASHFATAIDIPRSMANQIALIQGAPSAPAIFFIGITKGQSGLFRYLPPVAGNPTEQGALTCLEPTAGHPARALTAVDLDQDGREELILLGPDSIRLAKINPSGAGEHEIGISWLQEFPLRRSASVLVAVRADAGGGHDLFVSARGQASIQRYRLTLGGISTTQYDASGPILGMAPPKPDIDGHAGLILAIDHGQFGVQFEVLDRGEPNRALISRLIHEARPSEG